jgi:hypothetical protein
VKIGAASVGKERRNMTENMEQTRRLVKTFAMDGNIVQEVSALCKKWLSYDKRG